MFQWTRQFARSWNRARWKMTLKVYLIWWKLTISLPLPLFCFNLCFETEFNQTPFILHMKCPKSAVVRAIQMLWTDFNMRKYGCNYWNELYKEGRGEEELYKEGKTRHTHTPSPDSHTEIVLNTLKPDSAVETRAPGICGCQWISFTSVWPWCRKSSCGGRSLTSSARAPTSHDSTDRSHWLTTSSAPEAA